MAMAAALPSIINAITQDQHAISLDLSYQGMTDLAPFLPHLAKLQQLPEPCQL